MTSRLPTPPARSKILVVDDLPDNLRLLSELLVNRGYEVRMAPEGEIALANVIRFVPDLILLDIKMPGLSGYEVCARLKKNPKTRDIPIIFLSALNEVEDKVKAFKVGGEDYITKPFQAEEVIARIEHQLEIRSLQQQIVAQQKELETHNHRLLGEIEERKKAEEKAKSALQAKSLFLANMSHELRTPLNAILGFSKLLDRACTLGSEQKEYTQIVIQNGEYLLSLINEILDLSKIEAGRATLNLSDFDLYCFLSDLKNLLSIQASRKGLPLVFDCGFDLPQYVKTDKVKLRQILINLLGNGIKFTKTGRVILRVRSVSSPDRATCDRDRCFLHFEIEDTGPGIAKEELEKLFQIFEQTASGRQAQEGTGLGLAISRSFVELMGGEIDVSSVVGQGSIFRFQIPVTPSIAPTRKLDGAARSPASEEAAIVGLADGEPLYRILIVDDTRVNRLLALKLLGELGFEVREADNGSSAIAAWSRWHPHLILMDMRMPQMDGYQASREIRERERTLEGGDRTKIIALSASVLEDRRADILACGCDDFVHKPFEERELLLKIAEHLGLRYAYADDLPSHSDSDKSVFPELKTSDFDAMPLPWLRELHQAALALDDTRVKELFDALPGDRPDLAASLNHLVDNFRLDRIAELARSCMKQKI
ncbi:response regulator [Oxynema aestuarii]|uniref:Circadian input-output histidine kinase CikA n=1 Tax=Oxynema aestuarii AP17 TaxID=2064643 RepID=A0A6H1U0X5_9CYAN|nr:response regulator [Oxynema aestuarii]QIZ72305.1 response regulator [Oxynema aestuarii AP17]